MLITEGGPFRAEDLRGRLSAWIVAPSEEIRFLATNITTNRMTMDRSAPVLFTVGHSTRSFEELVEILRAHGVKRLVDVRRIPRSRHNPQFNRETLIKALHHRRINYRHMK